MSELLFLSMKKNIKVKPNTFFVQSVYPRLEVQNAHTFTKYFSCYTSFYSIHLHPHDINNFLFNRWITEECTFTHSETSTKTHKDTWKHHFLLTKRVSIQFYRIIHGNRRKPKVFYGENGRRGNTPITLCGDWLETRRGIT